MRTIHLIIQLSLICLCLGCGRETIQIKGNVTYDGKPIEEGTIEFIPIEGTPGPSTGSSIQQGSYECLKDPGLVRGGRYQVRITALAKTGQKMPLPPSSVAPNDKPEEMDVLEQYIPAAYNTNSTLTVTLSRDSSKNRFNFDLDGKGPAKG